MQHDKNDHNLIQPLAQYHGDCTIHWGKSFFAFFFFKPDVKKDTNLSL